MENLKNADKENLAENQDVGEITACAIYDYFNDKDNLAEIEKLLSSGFEIFYSNTVASNGILSGEKVVITGTLSAYKRKDAQNLIEKMGGQALSDVTKTTTLVIVGQDAGSKKAKAEKLGIKTIGEEEFASLVEKAGF